MLYPARWQRCSCFAYLGYREGSCPESELASREVLSLPIYPELLPRQQDETIGAIRSFFGR
jgi:dTDP-4-amino-4,6-dideoxygalactose transaminase